MYQLLAEPSELLVARQVVLAPQLLAVTPTGCTETTLPARVTPTSLLEVGTGDILLPDIGSDAHAALRYARAVAVLPTDRAHEERIDQLIATRAGGAGRGRSLRRQP